MDDFSVMFHLNNIFLTEKLKLDIFFTKEPFITIQNMDYTNKLDFTRYHMKKKNGLVSKLLPICFF